MVRRQVVGLLGTKTEENTQKETTLTVGKRVTGTAGGKTEKEAPVIFNCRTNSKYIRSATYMAIHLDDTF